MGGGTVRAFGSATCRPPRQLESTSISHPPAAKPGALGPGPQRSILGTLDRGSPARDLLPKEVVAQLDEELRWDAFLRRVTKVAMFSEVVDFEPARDALAKLDVYAAGTDALLRDMASAPPSGRGFYIKAIEDQVHKAHEYRLKASAEVFKILPTEMDTFPADVDLLSGK